MVYSGSAAVHLFAFEEVQKRLLLQVPPLLVCHTGEIDFWGIVPLMTAHQTDFTLDKDIS